MLLFMNFPCVRLDSEPRFDRLGFGYCCGLIDSAWMLVQVAAVSAWKCSLVPSANPEFLRNDSYG